MDIRTNKPAWVVAQVIGDVVDEALGQTGGPLREETLFTISDVFFTNAHTAYITKSHGWEDEFGDSWEPLSERTIAHKLGESFEEGLEGEVSPSVTGGTAFIPDATRRGEWIDRRDRLAAQLISGGLSSGEAQSKANSLAWGSNVADGGVPINIDTGLLANSLSPGSEGDRSIKVGQVRRMVGSTLYLGTDVDYAGEVHLVRPILPSGDNLVVWIRRGLAVVNRMIINEIRDRLQ